MRCYLVSQAHGEHAACTLHIHLEATPETLELLTEHIHILHQSGDGPALAGKLQLNRLGTISLPLWLLFYVCRKLKKKHTHRIVMKHVKYRDSDETQQCVIV